MAYNNEFRFEIVKNVLFLRMICEANNYDPEAIGKQMLETYTKMESEGVYERL